MAKSQVVQKGDKLPFESALEATRTYGFLHTGNYALNYAISGKLLGGWPMGHVVEIFGDNSSGKTYLLNRAFAEVLSLPNGDALLDDTEGAFNPDWAREHLGVDTDALRYTQSVTVKDHYEVAKVYLEWLAVHEKVAVLGLDGIAALTTEHELEKAFATRDLTRAQEVRMLFRTLKKLVRSVSVCYIITNHIIANIGGWNDTTTPTGTGLKFHAGTRIHLRYPRRLKIEGTKEYRGVVVNVFVEKNRFGPPWKQCSLAIPFYEPINPLSGLIPVLLEVGYFGVNSGHFLVERGGESTGIRAYKSDFLKQDGSAAQLLGKYPSLLSDADVFIEAQDAQIRLTGAEVLDD